MANSNVPYITGIVYDSAQIAVTWSPSGDTKVTGYVVNVSYAAEAGADVQNIAFTATNSTPGGASSQPITQLIPMPYGQLDSNVEYFIQVIAWWGNAVPPCPGQNETSQFVPLITQLPELLCSYYDGADLHFEWIPTLQATQGYTLNLQVGTTTFYYPVTSPSAGYGIIPASQLPSGGLSKSLSCVASVYAIGNIGTNISLPSGTGQVVGSSASITLPAGLPAVALGASNYQAGIGLAASWTAVPASSGATSYRLSVVSAATKQIYSLAVPGIASTNATMQFPHDLAPIADCYTFRLIALTPSGGGVASAAVPIISTLAQLVSVMYNATGKTVDLSWNAVSNASIGSYTVEVFSTSGTPTSVTTTGIAATATAGSVSIPETGFSTMQNWAARVWAVGATAGVAGYSAAVPMYNIQPVLAEVDSDGVSVFVRWQPVSGPFSQLPTGYKISLTPAAGGNAVVTAYIDGLSSSSGAVRLPDQANYLVQLALVDRISTGQPSTAVQAIVTAPTAITTTCDAITGQSTLRWAAVTEAATYTLDFSSGATPQSSSTNSFALPNTVFYAGAGLSVTLRAKATAGAVIVCGPKSPSATIPTRIPTACQATFDGASATAFWNPVEGASGYTATVLGTVGSTTTVVTSAAAGCQAASAPLGFTPVSGTAYSAVVQANFGATGNGPPCSALPLFKPGYFLSTTSSTKSPACPPFSYPATLLSTVLAPNTAETGEPFLLYLSDIGGGSALAVPIYSTSSATDSVFILNKNNGASAAAYPYTLTISNATTAANNPWNFSSSTAPIRSGLRAEYVAFLKAVELAGGVPFGINQLQQVIGRMLPQTFAEQLYYNFGLTFPGSGITLGSVDLRPGMVLRVVINPYQSVPGQSGTPWLSGYVGGSVIDYDIGSFTTSTGSWNVGFDAFIGQLIAGAALTVLPPSTNSVSGTEQGIAEAADLYFPNFQASYYRLFAPSQALQSPSGVGSVVTAANFSIAAANRYADLNSATNTPTANATIAYFRGRAILKACLKVSVDGAVTTVPVGTTLGNLLESAGRLPPPIPLPLNGIRVERGLAGAVLDGAAAAVPGSYPVRLNWVTAGAAMYGSNWNPLSMPLLPGDRISLG
ncbi:MAG: hypothetical protein ACOH2K_14020 [Burkholderiaceae bacterium]